MAELRHVVRPHERRAGRHPRPGRHRRRVVAGPDGGRRPPVPGDRHAQQLRPRRRRAGARRRQVGGGPEGQEDRRDLRVQRPRAATGRAAPGGS
ncbi:hypothetical protein G6F32_016239 [Rhizopus arrhizus]|nr:hypothetical protein G6F32_016239 [Rhizopus arrhizus]